MSCWFTIFAICLTRQSTLPPRFFPHPNRVSQGVGCFPLFRTVCVQGRTHTSAMDGGVRVLKRGKYPTPYAQSCPPSESRNEYPRSQPATVGAAGLLWYELVLEPPRWVLPVAMVSCRPRRGCCNAEASPWNPSSTSSMSKLAGNADAAGWLWYELVLEPPRWALPVAMVSCRPRRGCCNAGASPWDPS